MSYNLVSLISMVITAVISLLGSYYLSGLFFSTHNGFFFKGTQLVITIIFMSTFYAPIKFILIKYININNKE